jgi:hypothetical protein
MNDSHQRSEDEEDAFTLGFGDRLSHSCAHSNVEHPSSRLMSPKTTEIPVETQKVIDFFNNHDFTYNSSVREISKKFKL